MNEQICKEKILNQIKRCEGQLRGIEKMIDEEKNCYDILIQVKAVRSNIDSILGKIIANNLINCINEKKPEEEINKAINYINKK